MINCKDQTQNASDFDVFIDWDAHSKSDEMEVLTPDSTSTSFSTHDPNSLQISVDNLFLNHFNLGSMSPIVDSPSYETFPHGCEIVPGNGSSRISSATSYDVQHSDDASNSLNHFPGQSGQFNIVHDPRQGVEQMSLQAVDPNSNFQPSPTMQSPIFSPGQAFSEFLTMPQPPATEPWSHLDVSPCDVDRNRDIPSQYGNYGSQAPNQYQNQPYLLLTDSPQQMQLHPNPLHNEYLTQISHQVHTINNDGMQQPSAIGSLVEVPYGRMINPQSSTDLDPTAVESSNFQSIQMNYESSEPQTDHSATNGCAIYSYPGIPIAYTNEGITCSPTSMSPGETSVNSFSRASQGTPPSNSFSPSGQSPDSSKISGGGRQIGSKLKKESKIRAKRVRVIGSCWRCSLRRDSCGEGSPCPRCLDISISGSNLKGIECTRKKLKDLGFIPSPLSKVYEFKRVSEFRRTNFNGRTGRSAIVSLSVGRDLDILECELYEYLPKDGKPQRYVNYYTSPSGCGMIPETQLSENLELRSLHKADMPQYIAYVDRLLQSTLNGQPNFALACYAGEKTNFAKQLLNLLIESYQQLELQGPKKLALRNCLKLIISTYIVSRNITFKEGLSTMPPTFRSSRMANKQLKYFFFSIMASQFQATLNEMQQQLRHSCNIGQITSVVYSILCLAMSLDILLRYIYLTADHMKSQSSSAWGFTGDDVIQKAESFGLDIEGGFEFITKIFQEKFKKTNPFYKLYAESWNEKLEPAELSMFRNIDLLVRNNYEYLKARQSTKLSISNIPLYTSRLVSKFLLAIRPLA